MSGKQYGSYTEEDIKLWQSFPENARVLSSSGCGAWLWMRDERRDKKLYEELKAEIRYNGLYNEQIEDIIDRHIKELDNGN